MATTKTPAASVFRLRETPQFREDLALLVGRSPVDAADPRSVTESSVVRRAVHEAAERIRRRKSHKAAS